LNAALPAIKLSLVQIFLLIALLIAVFDLNNEAVSFNRCLQSGLDRSLHAIAQVVSNIVLVVGIFIVVENTGFISPLWRFSPVRLVWVGLRAAKILPVTSSAVW
jgi:hypothetical protein